LIRQLVLEEENHFENLALEQQKKKDLEIEMLNQSKAMQNRSGPIAVLQDSSLKLSARMVAVAGECQALDITLQKLNEIEAANKNNAKHLIEVANNMRSIESALSVCFDDFQRLMLVYNKFLNSKIDQEDERKEKAAKEIDPNSEYIESFLRVEISKSDNDVNAKDDFYAYMFDESKEKEDTLKNDYNDTDLEILNFEHRITSGNFRPVLKQLKEKINPIRKVMLEKEREVLAAKGFNVDELFDQLEKEYRIELEETDNKKLEEIKILKQMKNKKKKVCFQSESSDNEYDSDGSTDLPVLNSTKHAEQRKNYAEMRNLLAAKSPINIFKLGDIQNSPMNVAGNEEILESEC